MWRAFFHKMDWEVGEPFSASACMVYEGRLVAGVSHCLEVKFRNQPFRRIQGSLQAIFIRLTPTLLLHPKRSLSD